MAQIDELFEQVDQELEADRAHQFWREHQVHMVAALVALFAGLFAYAGWQQYRERRDQEAADRYRAVTVAMAAGQYTVSLAQLKQLGEEHGGHGYALLGELLAARSLAASGQEREAVARLQQVAEAAGGATYLRDLAYLQAAYLTVADREQCQGFLARIEEGSSYQPLALELLGVMADQRGEAQEALTLYQKALLKAAPGSGVRERVQQRVERLGGAK